MSNGNLFGLNPVKELVLVCVAKGDVPKIRANSGVTSAYENNPPPRRRKQAEENIRNKQAEDKKPYPYTSNQDVDQIDLSQIDIDEYRNKMKRLNKNQLKEEANRIGVEYTEKDLKQNILEKITAKIAQSRPHKQKKIKKQGK